MKTDLKIYFSDFWGYEDRLPDGTMASFTFNYSDNYFYHLFNTQYNVILDAYKPDVLIYGNFGTNHKNYSCKKISMVNENWKGLFPNHNECNISVSFHPRSDKNFYFPSWLLYINWFNQASLRPFPNNPTFLLPIDILLNKNTIPKNNFCSFIYNNPVQSRIELYNQLSTYKKIDSYGKLFNNMGGAIRGTELDKLRAMRDYKFHIAYENGWNSGYVTEKILHPLAVGSIPIYYGGDMVKEAFNMEGIIYASDFKDNNELVEYIKTVDNTPELYNNILNKSIFNGREIPYEYTPDCVLKWIINGLGI